MSEQPKCAACPYWQRGWWELTNGWGACKRGRPELSSVGGVNVASSLIPEIAGSFPATYNTEWCGEHPDFPAYLAALRAAKEQEGKA